VQLSWTVVEVVFTSMVFNCTNLKDAFFLALIILLTMCVDYVEKMKKKTASDLQHPNTMLAYWAPACGVVQVAVV